MGIHKAEKGAHESEIKNKPSMAQAGETPLMSKSLPFSSRFQALHGKKPGPRDWDLPIPAGAPVLPVRWYKACMKPLHVVRHASLHDM